MAKTSPASLATFHALFPKIDLTQAGSWDRGGMVACLVLVVGGLILGALGLSRRDVTT